MDSIEKKQPTITLHAEEVQFTFGPYLAMEVTVTGDGEVPTGTVSFLGKGGEVLGNATLAEGVARMKYSGFEAGPHAIKVTYSGDENYHEGMSNVVTHVSSKPVPPRPKATHPAITTTSSNVTMVPPVPDTREFEFEVNLTVFNTPTSLPDSRENLEHLMRQRTIGIPGVGNKRHGDRFKVPADVGERLLRSHSDYLRVVSKG